MLSVTTGPKHRHFVMLTIKTASEFNLSYLFYIHILDSVFIWVTNDTVHIGEL